MPESLSSSLAALADPVAFRVKRAIVGEVRAFFHDRARGEGPVVRRPDGLFGPNSVAWRVHADVTSMMVGGVAALLLQMLQPAVMAGVWDHSNFREDMLGRLRRTARFIAVTTYAAREDAEAAIARVRGIHDRVRGALPDGTPYEASDKRLLAWVHVAETTSFLDAWIRYGELRMTSADQDRYFAEMAQIAEALGADPVPRSRAEALHQIEALRSELRSDARTREVVRLVPGQRGPNRAADAFQQMVFRAAIDLLPPWARQMHGLPEPTLLTPLVRAGTSGMARAMRWAFR
ncbi:MAG TPA: oxygenase MpaB family protein [Stellaceae bacterium]|nr:oxygenase MpaB family protein [Stellaceae bacterium]